MPDALPALTPAAATRRISIYVVLAVLSSVGASVATLLGMSDEQLRSVPGFRWALLAISFVVAGIIAGLTAYRAAIDRSTSGGTDNAAPPTL